MKKLVLLIALAIAIYPAYSQGGYGNNGHGNQGNGSHGSYGNGGHNGPGNNNGNGSNYGHSGNHGGNQGGGPVYTAPRPMSSGEFNNALGMVKNASFESDRLRIAKQFTSNNLLTASQINSVMGAFSFESSKLAYAKYAYDFCFNPRDYYIVNNAFQFSSSVRELDQYVNSRGPVIGNNSNVGVNNYYGGGQVVQTTYASGSGNGMSYSGGVTTSAPACAPAPVVQYGTYCDLCHSYHDFPYICEHSFSEIQRAVDSRSFDSDKLLVAKQIVRDRLLSADQVRRLMLVFSFESSRLEFAKFAYRFTHDPHNYYVVNSSFTFSSSIRDLDRYIRSC